MTYWSDVPPATKDDNASRNAILRHLEEAIATSKSHNPTLRRGVTRPLLARQPANRRSCRRFLITTSGPRLALVLRDPTRRRLRSGPLPRQSWCRRGSVCQSHNRDSNEG